jgi:hypothetical protein
VMIYITLGVFLLCFSIKIHHDFIFLINKNYL